MASTEDKRAATAKWRRRNPDKFKAIMAAWRDKNRASLREYNKLYARKRRRKARIAAKRRNGK